MNKAIVAGFVIALAGMTGWYVLNKQTWSLMVCKERLNAAECANYSQTIDGFETQRECMREGTANFSRQGFECGKGCKEGDGVQTCKEVCTLDGCSK